MLSDEQDNTDLRSRLRRTKDHPFRSYIKYPLLLPVRLHLHYTGTVLEWPKILSQPIQRFQGSVERPQPRTCSSYWAPLQHISMPFLLSHCSLAVARLGLAS